MKNYDSRIRKIENPPQSGKRVDVTDFAVLVAEQLGEELPTIPVMFSNSDIKGVFQELAELQGL